MDNMAIGKILSLYMWPMRGRIRAYAFILAGIIGLVIWSMGFLIHVSWLEWVGLAIGAPLWIWWGLLYLFWLPVMVVYRLVMKFQRRLK